MSFMQQLIGHPLLQPLYTIELFFLSFQETTSMVPIPAYDLPCQFVDLIDEPRVNHLLMRHHSTHQASTLDSFY